MARTPDRPLWERLKRAARYFYLKVMRLSATPECVARGMAVGVFASWLPLVPGIPVHVGACLALCPLVRGSRAAAVATTFLVSNPLDWALFYWLQYEVGRRFIPLPEVRLDDLSGMLHLGGQGLLALTVGGTVIGLPLAVAAYFPALALIRAWRRRRAVRLLRRGG